MNINDWISLYRTMVISPLTINGKIGFLLSTNMRVFFKDARITSESTSILRRQYKLLKNEQERT
jgi:hypothetical protein